MTLSNGIALMVSVGVAISMALLARMLYRRSSGAGRVVLTVAVVTILAAAVIELIIGR